MTKHIAILQGHPDPRGRHFGNALGDAYADGARSAGHEVEYFEIAKLDFPLLRCSEDFYRDATPAALIPVQSAIRWADHVVILYPLWHGHFPAYLHAFFEQSFRPGFFVEVREGRMPKKLLTGKSARIIVTMGGPAFFYRWVLGAHSLKSLKRNILRFSGMGPIRTSLIGLLGGGAGASAGFPAIMSAERRAQWLAKMRAFGRQGS